MHQRYSVTFPQYNKPRTNYAKLLKYSAFEVLMKFYSKLLLPLCLLAGFSSLSYASSLGVQLPTSSDFIPQKVVTIYPSIPFIEGADLMEFHEAYSRTRSQQFGELVQSAESLIKAGASGKEALDMIIAFDELITKRREYSKKRMGVSLEGFFNSRLNDLYQYYNPQRRMLELRHVDIPSNILAHANQNYRPGYATEEMLSDLDFVIYGSYTVSSRKGQVDVALYAVNVKNGMTRVYGGSGLPEQAAYQAADKLFDEFQRIALPAKFRLANGKVITLVKEGHVSGGHASMKNLHSRAQASCDVIGARLIKEEEAIALDSIGRYNGGITLYEDYSNFTFNRHGRPYYYWALANDLVLNAPESRSSVSWNMNHAERINYLCVK